MLHDLRVAVRVLVQHRAFAVVTVLTLALGIGANTAIFSAVDAVLLRRPPVESIDRVGMLWETDRNSGTTREPASVPDYLDFRERSRAFAGLAALMAGEVNLSSRTEDPVRLVALRVTHDLLPLLGVFPVAGRAFTEAEDRLGGPRVALISDSLWQRAFGRSRSALGETLRLDEVPYTIVGVVPDTADFGVLQILSRAAYARGFVDRVAAARVDVWTALRADAGALPRDTHPIFVLGRLAPGASFETAQHDTAAIAADLERTHRSNDGRGTFVEPLTEVVFGPVRPALVILLGAVALVLLVACVNVANLLFARGVTRAREVAVRASLGAGLGRLTRQFLVENLVLTGAATAAGIGLAYLALRALVAFAPGDIPRLSSATIDLRVLGVTVAVSVLVALVFRLVPTVQAHRLDVQAAVQGGDGSRATAGRERSRLRSALVVTELSLAVVLVVGAVLLVKSFSRLLDVARFRPAGVLKAEYQLPRTRYPANFAAWPDFKEMHAFRASSVRRASALPGVERVAVVGNHPLDPGFTPSFTIVGREAEAAGWPEMSIRRVTPGYFKTVGLPFARGRLLQDTDGTTDAAVLLVNAAAARRFFGGRDPIGAQVRFWGAARTVVGVVADERFHGLVEAPPIGVYVPLAQAPSADGAGLLLVRTARRSRHAGLGGARRGSRRRPCAGGLRRGAPRADALAVGVAAAVRHAAAGRVRRTRARARGDRDRGRARLRGRTPDP